MLFAVVGLFISSGASAASLKFSPSISSFNVGDIFKISTFVDSQDVAINSVESNIIFPTDLLEVVSVSKSDSVFTFWVQDPSFSNADGTISFSAGLATPGYNGPGGKVLDIVLKAKKAGNASLLFSSSAVRANDGFGTDVLTGSNQAELNLISTSESSPKNIEVPTAPSSGIFLAPKISSVTNPDQNSWYNNPNPKFNWSLTENVTAVRLLYDKNQNTVPSVLYTPPVSEKEITELKDGTYYFHLQLKDKNGWSKVSNFKFNIDSTKPSSFNISEVSRKDKTEPQVSFIFDAKDSVSGIDHYEIQINDSSATAWKDDGTHKYKTSVLESGKHTLVANVFDKAGNYISGSAVFTVDSITAPKITSYPKGDITSNDITISGTTYPTSRVSIWLQKDNGEPVVFTVDSDLKGNFTFSNQTQLSNGSYTVWADVSDSRGARSESSEKISFVLSKATALIFGLSTIIPAASVLILIIIFILIYVWYRFRSLKKKIRKEARVIGADIHKSFGTLKDEIEDYPKMLKKAKSSGTLSEEEEKIIKQLRKTLNKVEDSTEKGILDIEKEVE